ncbi:hypothetical protein ACFL3Q_07485 [Planctomycetota bacterium]
MASERPACTPPVHIAERHDVLTTDGINIAAALAADTNAGNVYLFARGNLTRSSQNMPWNNRERRYGCCAPIKSRRDILLFCFLLCLPMFFIKIFLTILK